VNYTTRKPTIRPTHRTKYAIRMKLHELEGYKYLIFKKNNNQFHVFTELNTKELAERAGIQRRAKRNAQDMMKELSDKIN
jgi:hypothetical protein